MSVLTHVSASQIKDFKACNRLWYYTRILKQRAPQTEAQSRGTTVHGALEAHLKAGAIEPEILERAEKLGISQKDLNDYITAMAPFVGKPGEGLTEFRDSMPTFEGGPEYVLVVDHAREITIENSNSLPWEIIPQIDDLKTTSDFRYCKTPDELGHDVQMVSYAKWALWRLFELKKKPPPTFVSLRHVYVRTRGKRVATARDVLVTPADVEARWQEILVDVRDMVALASMGAEVNPQDVPATTTDHCSAYGGCFFRGQCFGAVYDTSRPFIGLFNKEKKEIVAMADNVLTPNFPANGASSARMSLKDRVAMRKGGAAPEASAAPDAAPAAASTPVGAPATPPPAAAAPAATAGVTCGASAALFPGCACTLVPHEGDHESRGPTGGAIHWSQDGASFGVGVSPNWKPLTMLTSVPLGAPGVAAPNTAAAVVASFSPSATVADVLPPDAPSRTSTPEEVAAAGASKRKPRTPKAEAVAPAAATAPAAAPAATPAPAVATAPAAAAGVCPLKELYVDSWPVKGVAGAIGLGEDILQGLSADAAKAANMPDWRLVEFGKGKGAMAVLLRERLASMPEILVVSSSTPGSDVLIEVLSPHAKRVVRALRG
jgi:hypothetical protein